MKVIEPNEVLAAKLFLVSVAIWAAPPGDSESTAGDWRNIAEPIAASVQFGFAPPPLQVEHSAAISRSVMADGLIDPTSVAAPVVKLIGIAPASNDIECGVGRSVPGNVEPNECRHIYAKRPTGVSVPLAGGFSISNWSVVLSISKRVVEVAFGKLLLYAVHNARDAGIERGLRGHSAVIGIDRQIVADIIRHANPIDGGVESETELAALNVNRAPTCVKVPVAGFSVPMRADVATFPVRKSCPVAGRKSIA